MTDRHILPPISPIPQRDIISAPHAMGTEPHLLTYVAASGATKTIQNAADATSAGHDRTFLQEAKAGVGAKSGASCLDSPRTGKQT